MDVDSREPDVLEAARRALDSALVIACALSLVLAVIAIGEQQELAKRNEPRVSVAPPRAQSFQPKEPPITGTHPMWIIPPRSHRFDRPTDRPDEWPVAIRRVAPAYTETAKAARISGIVIVEVVVGADGKISRGRVLKPLPFGMTQNVIDALREWRFRPGTIGEKPVPVIMKLAVPVNPDAKP